MGNIRDMITEAKRNRRGLDEGITDVVRGVADRIDAHVTKVVGATKHIILGHVVGGECDGQHAKIELYEYKAGDFGECYMKVTDRDSRSRMVMSNSREWEMECPFDRKVLIGNVQWACTEIFGDEGVFMFDSVDGETDIDRFPEWAVDGIDFTGAASGSVNESIQSRFRIPSRFNVGGVEFKVKTPKTIDTDGGEQLGCTCVVDGTISIADTAEGFKQSQGNKVNSFFHELTHCILDMMGENKLSCDEKFVTAFAGFLTEAMTSLDYQDKKGKSVKESLDEYYDTYQPSDPDEVLFTIGPDAFSEPLSEYIDEKLPDMHRDEKSIKSIMRRADRFEHEVADVIAAINRITKYPSELGLVEAISNPEYATVKETKSGIKLILEYRFNVNLDDSIDWDFVGECDDEFESNIVYRGWWEYPTDEYCSGHKCVRLNTSNDGMNIIKCIMTYDYKDDTEVRELMKQGGVDEAKRDGGALGALVEKYERDAIYNTIRESVAGSPTAKCYDINVDDIPSHMVANIIDGFGHKIDSAVIDATPTRTGVRMDVTFGAFGHMSYDIDGPTVRNCDVFFDIEDRVERMMSRNMYIDISDQIYSVDVIEADGSRTLPQWITDLE